jgi:hypothetical protein
MMAQISICLPVIYALLVKEMVPEVGLEPTWALSPPDFESGAYTDFATPA